MKQEEYTIILAKDVKQGDILVHWSKLIMIREIRKTKYINLSGFKGYIIEFTCDEKLVNQWLRGEFQLWTYEECPHIKVLTEGKT